MRKRTEEQKRAIWVSCLTGSYCFLTFQFGLTHSVWTSPDRALEILLTSGLSAFALVTMVRIYWPKSRILEVINVTSSGDLVAEHGSQNKDAPNIPVSDPSLKKLFHFCLNRTAAIRLLMFILIVFVLMGSIFERHGYLVVENQYLQLCMNYLHHLAIGFVLFRLIQPNGTQDLQGLIVAVLTTIFGHLYFALQTTLLYILVLTTRWWQMPRLIGVLFYTIFIAPIIVLGSIAICGYGPGPIVAPEPIRTMDGIYHLVKSYQGVRLYREVEPFPGVFLRKDLDYKQTGWPSYANIQKVADGKYEITTGEPPPEYFK
jgi:hypothetical protein